MGPTTEQPYYSWLLTEFIRCYCASIQSEIVSICFACFQLYIMCARKRASEQAKCMCVCVFVSGHAGICGSRVFRTETLNYGFVSILLPFLFITTHTYRQSYNDSCRCCCTKKFHNVEMANIVAKKACPNTVRCAGIPAVMTVVAWHINNVTDFKMTSRPAMRRLMSTENPVNKIMLDGRRCPVMLGVNELSMCHEHEHSAQRMLINK